jgi:hypothetical protein
MGDDWDRSRRRNWDEEPPRGWRRSSDERIQFYHEIMKDVATLSAAMGPNAPSDAQQAAERIRNLLGDFLDV